MATHVPMDETLNYTSKERGRLQALVERANFLDRRIKSAVDEARPVNHHWRREYNALRWALQQLAGRERVVVWLGESPVHTEEETRG